MTEKTETLFSLGDLVTITSHPYFEDSTSNILIKARAEFTPPILNIFEINTPEYFSETTGKKAIQYHCMYYDSKIGDFETKWFKESELKIIRRSTETNSNSFSDYLNTDKDRALVNKQCILNSVDIELTKLKSNYEGSFKSNSNKITAHLDFLPPLLEIIESGNNTTDKNYDKKTGKRIKNSKQVKCKWYNPIRNTFSEKTLPIDVLQLIQLPTVDQIKKIEKFLNTDYYFCYKSDTENEELTIASLKSIVFNHYKYEIYGENLITGKVEQLDNKKLFWTNPLPLTDKNKFFSTLSNKICTDNNLSILIGKEYPYIENQQYHNITFQDDQYYFITYKDKFDHITKRIIKVVDNFNLEKTETTPAINILEGICYLRNQETRHFNLNSILKAVKVNSELF